MRAVAKHSLIRFRGGDWSRRWDDLAVEEPLEVRLRQGSTELAWLVTMRTPGRDRDLVAGLLFAEGVITDAGQIRRITVGCPGSNGSPEERANRTLVELGPEVKLNGAVDGRATTMSSACGVCGRRTIDELKRRDLPPLPDGPTLTAAVVSRLPDGLHRAQNGFRRTGGTHAAGWFDGEGRVVRLAEDVGRHNAVDKVIGEALLEGALPAGEAILAVSGRLSWEILHKARSAGFPVVAGLGAPSTLAVQLAAEFGMTLCGFVRDGGFNVYSGIDRLDAD